jgi:hypothetical protein
MYSISEISDTLGDWPTGVDEPLSPPPNNPPNKPPGITSPPPPEDGSANNRDQWIFKKVQLIDGEFNYWEAKAGNAIFVDTKNLENVNLLTPAVAQKLFPS